MPKRRSRFSVSDKLLGKNRPVSKPKREPGSVDHYANTLASYSRRGLSVQNDQDQGLDPIPDAPTFGSGEGRRSRGSGPHKWDLEHSLGSHPNVPLDLTRLHSSSPVVFKVNHETPEGQTLLRALEGTEFEGARYLSFWGWGNGIGAVEAIDDFLKHPENYEDGNGVTKG